MRGKEIIGLQAVTPGSLLTHSFCSSFPCLRRMESGSGGSSFEIRFATSRMAGKPSPHFGYVRKTLMALKEIGALQYWKAATREPWHLEIITPSSVV